MTIHFQIEYITRWGENLFLCLNMTDGTQQCLDMANNGQGTWFTDYDINDDELAAGDITYSYMVQTDTCPPWFVVYGSNLSLLHWSYKRYLERRLREAYDFTGTPIFFSFRNRD